MGNIFMRVLNEKIALETLLYVFKNQMKWGKKNLTFTLKHRDGYKEWCGGSIDEVFKNHILKDIEHGDLLLLNHYDNYECSYIYFNDKIDIKSFADLSLSMKCGAHFIIPKGNKPVYFVIKDYPMSVYTIDKNEIISNEMLGQHCYIYNNMYGEIDYVRGVYTTITIP